VGYDRDMASRTTPRVFRADGESQDVVVLRWPEQSDAVERLDRRGIARLLLVEPDSPPPESDSCLQDWLRLPATDIDLRARLRALELRASKHPARPTVDEFGQISHRGRALFLSPLDHRIAQLLVEYFGVVVHEDELLDHVWPEGARSQALRVHVSRLRRRVAAIGLTVTSVRNVGYVMTDLSDVL
jgi:hypothetical protein